MSNLNENNVDVQRMILVLNELKWKIELCSCLTMNTLDKVRSRKEEIIGKFGEKVFSLVDKHYEIMIQFRQIHLIYKEEKKEEKNEDDEYEDQEDGQPKEITKEKQNLKELEPEVFSAHPLTKSTRNLYRELKSNIKFIDYLKELRSDEEIRNFSLSINDLILSHISKSKMTLEEEQSERDLNQSLKEKIEDMKIQIRDKENKLHQLVEAKSNFKKNCTKNLQDITNQIENLKKTTVEDMNALEEEINEELRQSNKDNVEELANINKETTIANNSFTTRKLENLADEKALIAEQNDAAAKRLQSINKYDDDMNTYKLYQDSITKDLKSLDDEIKTKRDERDKNKEQFELYNKAQRDYDEKVKNDELERKMEGFACNWIQSSFRGFLTRKTQKKKYGKILLPLKKVKPDMNVDKDPKKKQKGK